WRPESAAPRDGDHLRPRCKLFGRLNNEAGVTAGSKCEAMGPTRRPTMPVQRNRRLKGQQNVCEMQRNNDPPGVRNVYAGGSAPGAVAVLSALELINSDNMRPGSLARALAARTARVHRLPSMLAVQANAPRTARRAELVCASCGRVAAFVEEDPSGRRFRDYPGLRLVVKSGKFTRRHLQSVRCPEHGRLNARQAAVLPAAAAARDGRVRTVRLRPAAHAGR